MTWWIRHEPGRTCDTPHLDDDGEPYTPEPHTDCCGDCCDDPYDAHPLDDDGDHDAYDRAGNR